jgi:hypothetical protein
MHAGGCAGKNVPAVAQFSSGAVKGDVFYVAGGELPPSSAPVVVKNLWLYYVPTDTWVAGADLRPWPRLAGSAPASPIRAFRDLC